NVHLRGMLTVAAENVAGLQTDLKKANTKATVYYTSWKSLERHVNHKAKVVPSDEMNLAAAVTSLVEKGYIQNVQPGGQIPVEIMCSMVAGIAEKLPPTEAISFNAGDHVLEPVLEVGDPYPTEFRLHTNANGVVHSYFRSDKATPAYSVDVKIRDEKKGETCAVMQTNLPGLRAADVTGYEELEQINARLETQLTATQKELEQLRPLAEDRRNEIFFRTTEGVSYGCDNMSIGEDDLVSSLAIKVRRLDGTEVRIGFIPVDKANELVERIDERRRQAENWEQTAAQHARNEEFYRDLLDQVAVALQNPEVYKSDDGSIQQDPIRLK
ncbi:TPA: hypothetical protein ACLNTW_003698, partial [Vibrio cholerae O1]